MNRLLAAILLCLAAGLPAPADDGRSPVATTTNPRLSESRRLARFLAERVLDDLAGRDWLVWKDLDPLVADEIRTAAAAKKTPLLLLDSGDPARLSPEVRAAIAELGRDFAAA